MPRKSAVRPVQSERAFRTDDSSNEMGSNVRAISKPESGDMQRTLCGAQIQLYSFILRLSKNSNFGLFRL